MANDAKDDYDNGLTWDNLAWAEFEEFCAPKKPLSELGVL